MVLCSLTLVCQGDFKWHQDKFISIYITWSRPWWCSEANRHTTRWKLQVVSVQKAIIVQRVLLILCHAKREPTTISWGERLMRTAKIVNLATIAQVIAAGWPVWSPCYIIYLYWHCWIVILYRFLNRFLRLCALRFITLKWPYNIYNDHVIWKTLTFETCFKCPFRNGQVWDGKQVQMQSRLLLRRYQGCEQ